MPFLDSVQPVPLPETIILDQKLIIYILTGLHFLQEVRTKSNYTVWNGKFLLYHASSVLAPMLLQNSERTPNSKRNYFFIQPLEGL